MEIKIEIEGAARAGQELHLIVPPATRISERVFGWGLRFGVKVALATQTRKLVSTE
jgi:hypothetical protein